MYELLLNVISSIITGIVSGIFVSWIYVRKAKKEALINQFMDDKQSYSKYLGVVAKEIEINIGQNKNTDNLKRVLVEPHWYNSFQEKLITEEAGIILTKAHDALQDLTTYIDKEDVTGNKLMRLRSHIVISQINILKLSLRK